MPSFMKLSAYDKRKHFIVTLVGSPPNWLMYFCTNEALFAFSKMGNELTLSSRSCKPKLEKKTLNK